jgi:UDP:flavonoid glycosyltransferase YjiC (YdhE family)
VSSKRVLFALAGAGAGNLARVTAIVEALDRARIEIALLAQAATGHRARSIGPVYPLLDVTYGSGEFTAWQVLHHNGGFPWRYWRNRRLAARALDDFRPDLLVVDSDFYSLPEARRRGIPILSVNSAVATLAMCRRLRLPASRLWFSRGIEQLDGWLHQSYATRIVCPVLAPVETSVARVHLVAPVVRRQFGVAATAAPCPIEYEVAVMLGGSGLGTHALDLRGVRGSMVVVGDGGGRYPDAARRIAFTDQPASHLARARVLVIQGGLNSVSEAMALGKPAVIVPIANHLEQLVNATWAHELGHGHIATGATAGAIVNELLSGRGAAPGRPQTAPASCVGALQAAAHIVEMAGA